MNQRHTRPESTQHSVKTRSKGMMHHFTAVIHEETFSDGSPAFVAHCPETDVTSQGETRDEAMANLCEAVELLLEDVSAAELGRMLSTHTTVRQFEVAV